MLAAAVVFQDRKHLGIIAIKDAVDGVLAGHVLDLATAEVEAAGQNSGIVELQLGNHLLPDLLAHSGVGLLEHDLVKETALEGRVEVLGEVGGGNHDAVQVLHLLQDDVLHGVLHLIDSVLCARFSGTDKSIGLVEEQDGGQAATLHQLAVTVEDGLDVLLRLAHPLAADARHVNHHEGTTRLTRELIHRLGLARARTAIEKAGEALTEATLLHAFTDGIVTLSIKEASQLIHLFADSLAEKHSLRCKVVGIEHTDDLLFRGVDVHF